MRDMSEPALLAPLNFKGGERACFSCGLALSDNPDEVYLAIDQAAMEAQGLEDVSEIKNEAVIVLLCSHCGFSGGFPSVAQFRSDCEEMEREMERKELKQ